VLVAVVLAVPLLDEEVTFIKGAGIALLIVALLLMRQRSDGGPPPR
jgi:drug/metabolite transporter (DMT)-like permease